MDWRDYIRSDPAILSGKPVIKGTRLSVDFLLELFAVGWTEEQILDDYPHITRESLRAVFAFAAEATRAARLAAAERIGRMEVEDVPPPEELKRQFSEAHGPGGTL